jgi:hypothetical protein
VHAVQGYSALQPRCLQWYPEKEPPVPADWRADFTGDGRGGFTRSPGSSPARFRDAQNGGAFPLRILQESHNRLEIELPSDSGAREFIRTDTRFPGWKIRGLNALPQEEGYAFTSWQIPAGEGSKFVLEYVPATSRFWIPGVSAGAFLLLLSAQRGMRNRRREHV